MPPLPPPPDVQPSVGQPGSGTRDQRKPANSSNGPTRPQPQALQDNPDSAAEPSRTQSTVKRRKHRGGTKRRNRRQSFAAPPSETSAIASNMEHLGDAQHDDEDSHSGMRPGESFYKRRHNRSNESLDSDALLDHRHQTPLRPRRESRLNPLAIQRASMSATMGRQRSHDDRSHRQRRTGEHDDDDDNYLEEEANDRTPLIRTQDVPSQHKSPTRSGYRLYGADTRTSSRSSDHRKRTHSGIGQSFPKYSDSPSHDINNPPSVPGSPHLGATMDDPMMPDPSFLTRSPDSSRNLRSKTINGDALIDIDSQTHLDGDANSAPPSPRMAQEGMRRKRAKTFVGGDVDVCFPSEAMSEMADEDYDRDGSRDGSHHRRHRRNKREWPQLWVLDDWSREEKEDRDADIRRAQRVQEPVMVGGRLRPSRPSAWHREEEQAPYRYTYFNEEFEGTIHASTISELVPQNSTFKDLFIPEPPVLEDSSSESETDEGFPPASRSNDGAKTTGMVSPKQSGDDNVGDPLSQASTAGTAPRSRSQEPSRINSILSRVRPQSRNQSRARSDGISGDNTPLGASSSAQPKREKKKRYGPRPTFWLDVLCPTQAEMQVLAKAFGIHALTAEDILMQEAREKVELFKNYYFINYRTFEQDTESEDYLEPVNVYVVVFRHGILTFHFSQIPHPANVRRRIRQLKDYLILSSDWISYAIIDDITDIYVPMIHNIEVEVDNIDEAILNSTPGAFAINSSGTGGDEKNEKNSDKASVKSGKSSFSLPYPFKSEEKKDTSGYDMLRRVGETRKKVMSLYRLLGNKADVIKGFAKRCNESFAPTPTTEIGLYLGDIQDHILTMTSNLSHYETLLSRAHSNYLAQVSIRMNERSEQTSDILNKLTVLGTIVLPMNIICGMWGMNVKVPGQDIDNLFWFWGITAGLMAFAVACWAFCKKVYGIV